jgi:hypothetical protein
MPSCIPIVSASLVIQSVFNAHEVAVRALVPLLAASVAVAVVVAGTLGSIEQDLIVLGPRVADAPCSTADGCSVSVVNADS